MHTPHVEMLGACGRQSGSVHVLPSWDHCAGSTAQVDIAEAAAPSFTALPCHRQFTDTGHAQCGPECTAARCQKNKVVSRGVRLPLEIFHTGTECGWGVRCHRSIAQGTFIACYIGAMIDDCEAVRACPALAIGIAALAEAEGVNAAHSIDMGALRSIMHMCPRCSFQRLLTGAASCMEGPSMPAATWARL